MTTETPNTQKLAATHVVEIAEAHAARDWVDDYLGSIRSVCDAAIDALRSQPVVSQQLTTEQIEAVAHRMCWKYKHSTDPAHSSTYTFNLDKLNEFARKLIAQSPATQAARMIGKCQQCGHEHDMGMAATQAVSAPAWLPITAPGQVHPDDLVTFKIGGARHTRKVRAVLNPGSDREELVYNLKRNFYLITSMCIAGEGSQKYVMFHSRPPIPAAPPTQQGAPE